MTADRRTAWAALAAAVALAAGTAPAWAHGEKVVSKPDDDDRVARPPRAVTLTLSEAPTDDAVLEVTDGCGDDVVAAVGVRGDTVEARIAGGSPGRWHARYEVISAVDGHPTDGRWDFAVAGERDCDGGARGRPDGDDGGDGGDGETPGPGPTLARDEGDGGGGIPVVAVTAGVAALVAVALVARRFGAR